MYEAYFGFRHAPFGVTPDPRFLFRNPRYEEALSTLLYGIRERKGFVLLTGEVGTGKTTLLHTVISELANTPFVFVFNPVADFDQLLTLVCDELELEARATDRARWARSKGMQDPAELAPQRTDRAARLAALNRFLIDQLRAGRTTALLIDEGQNLSAQTLEDLRLLSNLEIPTEKLLQIVLVGQPELAARLADPSMRQLRQRIALRYELTALTVAEVGDFVRHRLLTAGATDESLIEPNALSQIARLSGGIPRLVNMICDNALLVCYGSSQRRVTSAIVDEVAVDLRLADAASPAGKPLDEARLEVERFAPQTQRPAEKVFPATASPLDQTTVAKALVAILRRTAPPLRCPASLRLGIAELDDGRAGRACGAGYRCDPLHPPRRERGLGHASPRRAAATRLYHRKAERKSLRAGAAEQRAGRFSTAPQ